MKNTFSIALVFLFATSVFIACGDGLKEKAAALDKETMTIHDEAMKTLGEMNKVSLQLKDELAKADSLRMDKTRRESLVATLAAMQKAEDDMMGWMSQYKSPDDLPAAEAVKYLEDQKQKISQNRQDLQKALELGSSLQKAK